MKKILNRPFCLAGIMTVLCLIIQSKISLYCSGIDGYLISMVSNGCYSENNYCMFIHPLVSYVCGKLSRVLPYADCYTLIIMSFMVFSLFLLYYLIFSHVRKSYKRVVLILMVICYVFSTCNGLTMRFTLQAGFCMFVGLLLLSMAFHDENKKYIIPGVLCCMFGCMIREQAAVTLLPFFGLLLLYELLANKYTWKVFFSKCVKYTWLAVACISILFLTNTLFYNQAEYTESIEYNNARSALVDYPIKEWENVKDKATGYSENDYYAVTHYIWEDSDIIDSEYLYGLSSIANNNFFVRVGEISTVQSKIVFTLKTILSTVGVNAVKMVWFEVGLVIILLSVYLFLKHKDLWVRLVLIFNLMGYFVIITFFALLGREVALKELLLAGNLLVLFYLTFVLNGAKERASNYKWNILKVVLLVYIAFQPFIGQKWFSPVWGGVRFASECNLIESSKVDALEKDLYGIYKGIPFLDGNRNSLIEMFSVRKPSKMGFMLEDIGEKDELYIWNVGDYDEELSGLQRNNKLPSKSLLSHHVAMGEWVSGQIYFNEHLEGIGARNLMKSLLDRPDTYYVGKNEKVVCQWLREHYSENIKIEHVKDIGEYPVWQFSKQE